MSPSAGIQDSPRYAQREWSLLSALGGGADALWVLDQAWKPHHGLLPLILSTQGRCFRPTQMHILQAIEGRPWSRRFTFAQAMRFANGSAPWLTTPVVLTMCLARGRFIPFISDL